MNRRGGLVLLAVAVTNLAVPAPATAQVPVVASGRLCGFGSVNDPTIQGDPVQTGQMNGGPLVAASPGATIAMRCTIQVGAVNPTHAGADSVSISSAALPQTASFPPTLMSYLSPEGQPVFVCTEATISGQTWYYDVNPPGTGTWVQSSAAACAEAITQEIFPGPFGPVLDILFPILDPILLTVDGIACPVIGLLAPGVPGIVDIGSEGDVHVLGEEFWRCPPYLSSARRDESNHDPSVWIVCAGSSSFTLCV